LEDDVMTPERSHGPFATITHARLRAEQGDVAGALRIVGMILDRNPDDGEARHLAMELRGRATAEQREEGDAPPAPVARARASELAERFAASIGPERPSGGQGQRGGRLEAWLERIERARGVRRVR
jgi:hypothetical protein